MTAFAGCQFNSFKWCARQESNLTKYVFRLSYNFYYSS